MLTLYAPAGRSFTVNWPLTSVATLEVTPVFTFATLTRAPANGPPCFSETLPVIEPVGTAAVELEPPAACACELSGQIKTKRRVRKSFPTRCPQPEIL